MALEDLSRQDVGKSQSDLLSQLYHTEDTALSPTWRWEVEIMSQKTKQTNKKRQRQEIEDEGEGEGNNGEVCAPEGGQRTDGLWTERRQTWPTGKWQFIKVQGETLC